MHYSPRRRFWTLYRTQTPLLFWSLVLLLAFIVLGVLLFHLYKEQQQLASRLYLSDLRSELAVNLGQPGDNGNLLGIEAKLVTSDFQSPEQLRAKLAGYLNTARQSGLLNGKTIVVLPEHIGTGLVAAHERDEVYQSQSLSEASRWVAASKPGKLLTTLTESHGDEAVSDALFRMKARQMARDYQQLFGKLAKDYRVTLVAGSIVLPEPSIQDGKLKAGDGPLYNVSVVFAADGKPMGQPQRKHALSRSEKRYAEAGDAGQLQIFETPAGRLAVLIGNDRLQAEHYTNIAQAELLATPAFLSRAGEDYRPEALTNLQAKAGVTVFMAGRIWHYSGDDLGFVATREQVLTGQKSEAARLLNLWL